MEKIWGIARQLGVQEHQRLASLSPVDRMHLREVRTRFALAKPFWQDFTELLKLGVREFDSQLKGSLEDFETDIVKSESMVQLTRPPIRKAQVQADFNDEKAQITVSCNGLVDIFDLAFHYKSADDLTGDHLRAIKQGEVVGSPEDLAVETLKSFVAAVRESR